MSLLITSSLPARSAGAKRLSSSTKGTQFIFIRVFINWITTRVLNKKFYATFFPLFCPVDKVFRKLEWTVKKKIYLKFFFLRVPEARHQLIATVRETLLQHFLKSIMSWETVTTHHKHSFDGETPSFIGSKLSQNNQHLIL